MDSGTSFRSTPPIPEPGRLPGIVSVPSHAALAELLDEYAPLRRAPVCPELSVFHGIRLIAVWEAAERLAGRTLPAPFWAYPWPGGIALARFLLDRPERVRKRTVLDVGAGGGIASLAAARIGARDVVANDVDPWALGTARLAAERQGLAVQPSLDDLTELGSTLPDPDVVLCGDLAYERRTAPRIRALLDRARREGAHVLAADAGRPYFERHGLRRVARFTVPVPEDVEGTDRRVASVYEWP